MHGLGLVGDRFEELLALLGRLAVLRNHGEDSFSHIPIHIPPCVDSDAYVEHHITSVVQVVSRVLTRRNLVRDF